MWQINFNVKLRENSKLSWTSSFRYNVLFNVIMRMRWEGVKTSTDVSATLRGGGPHPKAFRNITDNVVVFKCAKVAGFLYILKLGKNTPAFSDNCVQQMSPPAPPSQKQVRKISCFLHLPWSRNLSANSIQLEGITKTLTRKPDNFDLCVLHKSKLFSMATKIIEFLDLCSLFKDDFSLPASNNY